MSSGSGRLFQYGRNLSVVLGRANSNSISSSFGVTPAVSFCNTKLSGSGSCLQSSSASLPPLPGDPSKEPFIPAYQQKQGESIQVLKARLLYQSRKRGMLENGLLLSTFAAKFLNSMNETELKEYDRLINLPSNDWDIFYWATGVKPIPKEFDTAILHKFIQHVQNADKESRIRQPDLN